MQRLSHQCRICSPPCRLKVMNCTQYCPEVADWSYSGEWPWSVISTCAPDFSNSANMGSGLFRNQRSASTYVTRSTLGSASNTKRGANGVSVQQYSPRVLLGLTSFREVDRKSTRLNSSH